MVTKYTSSALLKGYNTAAKTFLTVCFVIWGVVGLFITTAILVSLTGSVGVGTSAYLTMWLLYWVGGMMLFGFGALLAGSNFDFRRPEP